MNIKIHLTEIIQNNVFETQTIYGKQIKILVTIYAIVQFKLMIMSKKIAFIVGTFSFALKRGFGFEIE